jgi:hypothetical protein
MLENGNVLSDPPHGEKMHDGTIQRAHLEEKWMMEMV